MENNKVNDILDAENGFNFLLINELKINKEHVRK